MPTELIVRVWLTFIELTSIIIFISVATFFIEIPEFPHLIQTGIMQLIQ